MHPTRQTSKAPHTVPTPLEAYRHKRDHKQAPALAQSIAAHPAGKKRKNAPNSQSTKTAVKNALIESSSNYHSLQKKAHSSMHSTTETATALQISAHLALIEAQLETLALQVEADNAPVVPNSLMATLARNTNEALRHVAAAFNALDITALTQKGN